MTARSRGVPNEHVARMAHFDSSIPLFAENAAHSSVPLNDPAAAARSGGQERPQAGACALLLTDARTAACSLSAASFGMRSISARWTIIGSISVLATNIFGPSAAQNLSAAPLTAAASQPSDPYAPYAAEASRRFGIPDRWVRAVMQVESGGDPRAVSKRGAIGLMQVMPATWHDLRERYGLGDDPIDPHDNIIAGTAYLREMYDRFGPDGFLAAYNAGPERYVKSRDDGLPLPDETQRYVAMLRPFIKWIALRSDRLAQHGRASVAILVAVCKRDRNHVRQHQDSTRVALSARLSRDAAVVDLSALVPTSDDLFVARSKATKVP